MTTPFTIQTGRLAVPVTGADHARGPATAPVTLVEYGDYQCPYCGMAYPVVEKVMAARPDTVRLVFRHFPIAEMHPYAEPAAELAEAAGTRGRFWQTHDWLFTHQDELDPQQLTIQAAKLDPAVVAELREHTHLDKIHSDFIGGVRSGVNGTPTFFVNGVRYDGGYALRDLLLAVDDAA